MHRFDAAGWAIDPVQPVARDEAYTLFCPEANARFDERALATHASSLLRLALTIEPSKKYGHGGAPTADVARVKLSGGGLAPYFGTAGDRFPSSYLLPQAYPEGAPTHPAYGAGHAGNNNTWYYTQGDQHGDWGYVAAVHLSTSSAFDANPSAYGLPYCP